MRPPEFDRRSRAKRMKASVTLRAIASTLLIGVSCSWLLAEPALVSDMSSAASDLSPALDEITVTARRIDLIGKTSTASEGIVEDPEIQLAPTYRPGQLLETVPGLVVTLHSGEGKANQYLLRGYNLDHGTDRETDVDGTPINQPTHARGQGYTDLNFMIPELADSITYTKGPYYAQVGDFGAVGSGHVGYRDTVDPEVAVTLGTLGYQRLLAQESHSVGDGQWLTAA